MNLQKKIKFDLELQNYNDFFNLPSKRKIKDWMLSSFSNHLSKINITIRFVNEQESQDLNLRYRGKNAPTNVLSFNYGEESDPENQLMGDLVICVPVLLKEAFEQHKLFEFHLAHLILHGSLHLQGYNHENDQEIIEMESKEKVLLAHLGFPDPYVTI